MSTRIIIGDVRAVLKRLPSESVHCIVTSPPYFGLRDYGNAGQIGLEPTPDAYMAELVAVFCECRRVLRADGTFWLNLGDSYSRNPAKGKSGTPNGRNIAAMGYAGGSASLADKQRLMIPARVALALQSDGWWLRDEIIWRKPNPMPVSVTDRTTPAHEMLYMFARSPRYYYDMDAIKEPIAESSKKRYAQPRALSGEQTGGEKSDAYEAGNIARGSRRPNEIVTSLARRANKQDQYTGFNARYFAPGNEPAELRQPRSVWSIPTRPFKGAHFATFPPDLIRPCILAGCPPHVCSDCGAPQRRIVAREKKPAGRSSADVYTGIAYDTPQSAVWGSKKDLGGDPRPSRTIGWRPTCGCRVHSEAGTVLDPFFGAGTTALVAIQTGRNCIGIELNPNYAGIAALRLAAA